VIGQGYARAPGPVGRVRYSLDRGARDRGGADIIQTIVVPTLGTLGGIVVIRTVIVYFLNRELSRDSKHRA
jgi:hypothetical protein